MSKLPPSCDACATWQGVAIKNTAKLMAAEARIAALPTADEHLRAITARVEAEARIAAALAALPRREYMSTVEYEVYRALTGDTP